MTKKAKKRCFDETETKNEEQNVKIDKQINKDSPKKKKKIAPDDLINKKEQVTNLLKGSEEPKLSPDKLKKKKNKKSKKHEKIDVIEADISQSKSKKKKKNKKDKKEEKGQSIESTNKTEPIKTKNQDVETASPSKSVQKKVEATETNNQDTESPSKYKKKKKNKKHKKEKQPDKSDEKTKSNTENSEKSDNKSVTKVKKDISSKRKNKYTAKRKEFRNQTRKLMRQEDGQFSSINKLSLAEIKEKIAEIESRENLSKNAGRKLRILKKKVQVEEGNIDNVKTQKRKSDEIEERKTHCTNKKIKKEGSLDKVKNNVESPSKKEKERSPKKFKKDQHNLSKEIAKKELFVEDRIGNTINKDEQEKHQIKPMKKELFEEDKIGTALTQNKIYSPNKKHEKLKIVKSEIDSDRSCTDLKKKFKVLGEYDSNKEVDLNNTEHDKDKEYTMKSPKSVFVKNLINGKNKKNKINNGNFENGMNDDSDEIQNIKSESKIVNKKKSKSEKTVNLDKEEGELEESDSVDDYNESNHISLKKGITINNKESLKSLSNQKKNKKKFEQKSSDKEDGELEESDSDDNNYSKSDDVSVDKEVVIDDQESLQNLKNQKKKINKFEQKSLVKEGELEESESSSQSDEDVSNIQAKFIIKQKIDKNAINANPAKKQRYVLFLGNLAYETTTVDLKKHFLTKVTKVKDVRIPLDLKTRKPRGFGYIEVENSEDYEKALSLHGTFVKGRPLKVQYTASGSKKAGNKKEIIQKNKKLHALRRAGKLAGSTKDSHKRSFRRNFKRERTQK